MSVAASTPLSSTGGRNPTISLGTVGTGNGGTGLTTAPTGAGQFLRSNGTAWSIDTLQSTDIPNLSGTYLLKDGSNATAGSTWGINVTGNAGTVTNGVYTTGDQTIGGNKTFSNTIIGNISGSAASVTGSVAASQITGQLSTSNIPPLSGTYLLKDGSNATSTAPWGISITGSAASVTGSVAAGQISGVLTTGNIPDLSGSYLLKDGSNATSTTPWGISITGNSGTTSGVRVVTSAPSGACTSGTGAVAAGTVELFDNPTAPPPVPAPKLYVCTSQGWMGSALS
jgi:hypothetical protein